MILRQNLRPGLAWSCLGVSSRLILRRWLGAYCIALLSSLAALANAAPEENWIPEEVARADDGSWSVETLGEGVHLFRWWPGFYVSPFLVGRTGVLAVDPISREVAPLYREAIAAVTSLPITKIIYSHDHRDHIVGADVLAPDAAIYAHAGTLASLKYRGDRDVPLPDHLVGNGGRIDLDDRSVAIHYFGPNHGRSNIAIEFTTGRGQMLAYVDTLEIGIVPYRTLPDTHVHGYLESLRAAARLEVDWVLGGHSGPGPAQWIDNYLNYFLDMKAALSASAEEASAPPADSVEDVIFQGEMYTEAIIAGAIDRLRPRYGDWQGFEAWAPMNAQTVWMYMITGN